MTRKRFEWKVRDRQLVLGPRTLIMGVLNLTPDSFSDGGDYSDPDRAYGRAMELEDQGADIIDIGAESTRPGSSRISEGEELRRLVPVLKRLKGKLTVPISVDTYKGAVAEKAIEHGAVIINDPSGGAWDPGLAKVVAQHDAGLVLNHMRGTPDTWAKLGPLKDLIATIRAELDAAVSRARRSGVPKERIVVDPGIGFGKRKEQNAEIIALLNELQPLLLPILVGPSRKSFLAQKDPRETEFATAAAVTAAILNGADIVRVHDVAAMRSVCHVADEIVAAIPEASVEPARTPRQRPQPTPESRPPKPVEKEAAQREDRRPRREFGPPKRYRDDRPPEQNRARKQADEAPQQGRPPRREFGPPKRDRDDRPPRREFRPGQGGGRPPRREGPPDRRPFKPRGPGRGPKPAGKGGGRPPNRGPKRG